MGQNMNSVNPPEDMLMLMVLHPVAKKLTTPLGFSCPNQSSVMVQIILTALVTSLSAIRCFIKQFSLRFLSLHPVANRRVNNFSDKGGTSSFPLSLKP